MLKGDMDERTRLYGEIERLIKIRIEGEEYEVPDELELLRCYQFLNFHIAYERFCWNATCENCATKISKNGAAPTRILSCQTPAYEGMEVTRLPKGVEKPGARNAKAKAGEG